MSTIAGVSFQKLSRIAFAVGLLAIVMLSLVPQDTLPSVRISDKINHFLAYGCVALAGGFGFGGIGQRLRIALGMLLLGAGLELLQGLMPSRYMSLADIYANVAGILAGLLLVALIDRCLGKAKESGV
jgi:VanZ family protein